jgi:uncharacterized protein YtpQ (UPF0354 family)
MNFEEMKTQIYPWIKKSEQDSPEEASKVIKVDMPMRAFLADLLILFVADMGDHFEVLQWNQLPEGMTFDELYGIAVQNLTDNIDFKLSPANFGGFGLLAGGDHEAGALCLDFLWEFSANHIGENLIIAVPAKDMVLMVGESQTETLERMKQLSTEIIEGGDRTLTETLFFYDKDKKRLSIYES